MTVIPFPEQPRPSRFAAQRRTGDPALILVLPTVRVERHFDDGEELLGRAARARVRRSLNLLRHALKGAPPPLDGPQEPV